MSIDDLKNISAEELKSAAKENIAEAKGSLKDTAAEQIEEKKEELKDAAVDMFESKAHEAIDHVADSIGLDKQMTAQIKVAL